jgi:hypothetical protein
MRPCGCGALPARSDGEAAGAQAEGLEICIGNSVARTQAHVLLNAICNAP